MTKYIPEIFEEVNKDPSLLVKYKQNQALRFIFEHAFIPENKMDLPEGEPPFKQYTAILGMTPANFVQETKRLYVFTKHKKIPILRKEQLFIQMLESIHPLEAKILIAIKDQTLDKLYPNITAELAQENGFIPKKIAPVVENVQEKKEQQKQKRNGKQVSSKES